ncbi:hypothetical protein KHQ06_33305 [Nocardia tengchongensis]|uniref:DUF1023 domain-containing protein n=1 Tax=Nocardia tengchongensis TaxID=2055889 RepID=A0ABX8CLR7_9NOCA|nr:alpha/beta hydrolase [Nocardia tengchongensis]QVI20906.1 hypothetical protein KHQ06_33305 [Nocardia tengchongensis]
MPGTGAKASNIGDDIDRADRMFNRARLSGAQDPAVITWVGYDTPPTPVDIGGHLDPTNWDVADASNQKYADAGADALDKFQAGLRATHDGGPSYNTVVAHSYGTTLVGDAAAHGRTLDANAVALVASPGTTVDYASDLHLTGIPEDQTPKHVYVTTADHDPIQVAQALQPFGMDPQDNRFGATKFSSDPGQTDWTYLTKPAHSEYWDIVNGKPNKALVNLGDIIAGREPTAK